VNYRKERKYDGWKKSRIGRLIHSKGNFVSIEDMFSLSEVCILLSKKPNVLDSSTSLQPLEDLKIHVDCVFVI